MSASRSIAGSVNSGYRGRNTASVVMRAALGVDCNEPSAVGTARNWLPADASKPAARTAVRIAAESRTQTGKTQNECSAAATPGHSTTNADRLANCRPSRARRSSRSVETSSASEPTDAAARSESDAQAARFNASPGKLRTACSSTLVRDHVPAVSKSPETHERRCVRQGQHHRITVELATTTKRLLATARSLEPTASV